MKIARYILLPIFIIAVIAGIYTNQYKNRVMQNKYSSPSYHSPPIETGESADNAQQHDEAKLVSAYPIKILCTKNSTYWKFNPDSEWTYSNKDTYTGGLVNEAVMDIAGDGRRTNCEVGNDKDALFISFLSKPEVDFVTGKSKGWDSGIIAEATGYFSTDKNSNRIELKFAFNGPNLHCYLYLISKDKIVLDCPDSENSIGRGQSKYEYIRISKQEFDRLGKAGSK